LRPSTSLAFLAFVSLTACGPSTWPVLNTAGVSANNDDETLTLQFADESTTLSRYLDLEEGSFVVGIDDPEGIVTFGRVLAVSGTESTLAVLDGSWDNVGVQNGKAEIARLQEIEPASQPNGVATYTGSYIGASHTIISDTHVPTIERGDLVATINFDSATFNAEINDIRSTIDAGGTPFQFLAEIFFDNTILPEGSNYTSLVLTGNNGDDGVFSGTVVYGPFGTDGSDEPPMIPETPNPGNFSALVGGENGSELVGHLEIGSSIGVFSAGH